MSPKRASDPTDLLRQVRGTDAQLGADLEKEFSALTKRRSFGLVFERHQPEAVELPGQPIRRGVKVRVLQPRGETTKGDSRMWRVDSIESNFAGKQIAQLIELVQEAPERMTAPTEDLVVVAEFDDKIYPGLVETGRVERGGDKPFHTVINAENFHALEMLTYTHRGKVDAIYIDPPYNTGSRDWKYNNDYVEGDDDYRHSKWLAFMERRLLVARKLLNPDDSVLIVTIDEKEYLRLGMLLEQIFPEGRQQMVSSVINPAGSSRPGSFSRTDEYVFVVQFGDSSTSRVQLSDDWRVNPNDKRTTKMLWSMLKRTGTGKNRTDSPNLFYPIFVNVADGTFHSVGEVIPLGTSRRSIEAPEGTVAAYPIHDDGGEGRWQVSRDSLFELIENGYVRVGRPSSTQGYTISYLKSGEQKKVLQGIYEIHGRRADGSVISNSELQSFIPGTAWRVPSHDASRHGSNMIKALMPDRKFPFPKSLFAVEDSLRFFVKEKPNAVILDFFSGSGTTAHAVMRLNRQDQGRRQCISITNNEVSADEQGKLRKRGLRPGDAEWERWGICDYITKPRIRAAITGKTFDGEPIKGEYKFTDEFPMAEGFEENAAFFTLTYEAPLSVRHNRAFERIASMLWLRAGATGRIIDDLGDRGWDISSVYAVLENIDDAESFFGAMRGAEAVHTVFVVTDDDAAFQMVCRELVSNLNVVRLYESYLQNFEINQGRGF
ncbi:site-specific DNA-methyltransferase [Leucobacter sp. G161]|uniref:site-specific DNA-methyltransferase n=1 Tax=Leucobacter sp. G161 TaxID=663704 RepID=UPI00073C4DC3|nr:DNA methyltransferase [Leucobacter sp. G161]KUF07780.1 DNA methyltransferase [Leucobacter sp. G161]